VDENVQISKKVFGGGISVRLSERG
jgi:hypothetical protein